VTPYRIAAGEAEIILTTTSNASWWTRLRQVRRRIGIFATVMGVGIGVFVLLGVLGVVVLEAPSAWAVSVAAGGAILWAASVALAALALVLKSAAPNPLWRALPRVLALRAGDLRIVPHDGQPHDAKWSFLSGYRVERARIILVLGRAPLLELELPDQAIAPPLRAKLLEWLELHDVPRD
jgi:hypothetical protein